MNNSILPAEALAKLDALFPPDPLAAERAVYERAAIEHRTTFGPPVARSDHGSERPRRESGSHGQRKLTRRARMAKRGGR